MLFFRKSLKSIGLFGICATLGGNTQATDGYLPLETGTWEEFRTVNSPASGSLSSSFSEEYEKPPSDPDLHYYCNNFLFDEDEQSTDQSEEQSEIDQKNSELQMDLYLDFNSYSQDAQEYILCHTDLKNIRAKGGQICNALIRMKELGVAANSNLISQLARDMLNIEFKAHVDVLPKILRINSTESKMDNDPTLVTLPAGNSITIPTYTPIADQVQGLHITTRADACCAQNIIDDLILQTTAIIDDITNLQNKIWLMLHCTSQKITKTMNKLGALELIYSEPQHENSESKSDSEESFSSDSDSEEESSSQVTSERNISYLEKTSKFDSEEYSHSYDKILEAHLSIGDEITSHLHDMQKNAYVAHSEQTSDSSSKEILDMYFHNRIQSISKILGYGKKDFSMGYYKEAAFTLPRRETITVPGYKPIIDKIQGLSIVKKEDAFQAINILEDLLCQTTDIVFEIAMITMTIK